MLAGPRGGLLMRCLPWPLAVLCWADNRAHGRQGWDEPAGFSCRAHDLALHAWVWLRIHLGMT